MNIVCGKKNLHVLRSDFAGRDLIDVRELYRTDEGELAPTKKGISIERSSAAKLVLAIMSVAGLTFNDLQAEASGTVGEPKPAADGVPPVIHF
jgi:hypothetical protein